MPIQLETGTEELLCHLDDRVAVVTLNKPHKKNALGDILTPALRLTLAQLETDDRVGCILLTGAGDAFCSGGDVSGMSSNSGKDQSVRPKTMPDRVAELVHKQSTLTLRLYEHPKLTVAALPGAAAGAGLSIALACDLRVASTDAFATTAFRNIGLSGDYGSSWFLPRLIGMAKAKELFYTARRVDAQEGERLGLFNRVFPAATFRDDALAYAKALADGPSNALGRMKQNLQAGETQNLRDSLVLEAEQLMASMGDAEAREAISAFMEKRNPVFHT